MAAVFSLLAMAAAPAWAAINEAQAFDIVFNAMRQVNPEFPQHCLSLMIEGRSRRAFDIAVRERHGGNCPGDPLVSPIMERFRVKRSPPQLLRLDMMTETYRPCPLTSALQPKCPQ